MKSIKRFGKNTPQAETNIRKNNLATALVYSLHIILLVSFSTHTGMYLVSLAYITLYTLPIHSLHWKTNRMLISTKASSTPRLHQRQALQQSKAPSQFVRIRNRWIEHTIITRVDILGLGPSKPQLSCGGTRPHTQTRQQCLPTVH